MTTDFVDRVLAGCGPVSAANSLAMPVGTRVTAGRIRKAANR